MARDVIGTWEKDDGSIIQARLLAAEKVAVVYALPNGAGGQGVKSRAQWETYEATLAAEGWTRAPYECPGCGDNCNGECTAPSPCAHW